MWTTVAVLRTFLSVSSSLDVVLVDDEVVVVYVGGRLE